MRRKQGELIDIEHGGNQEQEFVISSIVNKFKVSTYEQLADMIGISRSRAYRLCKTGKTMNLNEFKRAQTILKSKR